jgi:ABC-type multidrug transport system fused ATPase/permease subunit
MTRPCVLVNRSLSRQSSPSYEDADENDVDRDDAASSMSLSRTKRWFRTPFLFRVMKYNAPERYWIVLGSIAALVLGMIQPLFALVFSKIYGLFAEPSVNKQQQETNVYAGLIFGAVAQFLCFFSFSRSGEYLTLRMRKLTFAALLRQEMGYFDYEANSVGALVTRISTDASSLKVSNMPCHI